MSEEIKLARPPAELEENAKTLAEWQKKFGQLQPYIRYVPLGIAAAIVTGEMEKRAGDWDIDPATGEAKEWWVIGRIKYTADGEFAERLYKKNPSRWCFCQEPPLTYYNWLKP